MSNSKITIKPEFPLDPGFYLDPGSGDWLRTAEGVWLHSEYPFNERWALNASKVGARPFMLDLEPIEFDDLSQPVAVPGDEAGLYLDDRDALLWLRTIEGVWLIADVEAPEWWALDMDNMLDIRAEHLRRATLAEAQRHCADYDGEPAICEPLAMLDAIAASFGE